MSGKTMSELLAERERARLSPPETPSPPETLPLQEPDISERLHSETVAVQEPVNATANRPETPPPYEPPAPARSQRKTLATSEPSPTRRTSLPAGERAGHTELPHAVTDGLLPTLDPFCQAIFIHLWRLTVGWRRDECWISIPALCDRARMGRTKATVALKHLQARELIERLEVDGAAPNVADRGIRWRLPMAAEYLGGARVAKGSRRGSVPRAEPMKENMKETVKEGLSDPLRLREARRRELLARTPDASAAEIEAALDGWE